MSITISINAKKPRDEKRQIVFFTITKNSKPFKFTHGSVPVELDTDAKIKTFLVKQKDKLMELIENKIANGTYRNEHPMWIKLETQIDSAFSNAAQRTILKKIVRRIA